MKTVKKPSKRTSARVAKIAAKYFDMSDDDIAGDVLGMHCELMLNSDFLKFCKDIRAICGSLLSQTEPEAKGKKR